MPALNFQRRFVSKIESGEKRGTIREKRKIPFKVGDPLYLYTGMRTSKCESIILHYPLGIVVHPEFTDLYIKSFKKGTAYPIKCERVNPILICQSKEIRIYSPDCSSIYEMIGKNNTKLQEKFAKDDGFDTAEEFYDFFLAGEKPEKIRDWIRW